MEVFSATNLAFILRGFGKTILISVLAIIFSIIVGTVLALVKQYCRGRLRVLSVIASAYIELFRCTPNLLWILFVYFTVNGNDVLISVLAFTLFTSAVMAEIVRGGLNSVPKSQFEAAQSQGFGFFQSMRLKIIPALFGQCTTVVKDSSYLAGINVAEFMYCSKVIMASTTSLSQILLVYGFVFLLYFALNFSISLAVRSYQRKLVAA